MRLFRPALPGSGDPLPARRRGPACRNSGRCAYRAGRPRSGERVGDFAHLLFQANHVYRQHRVSNDAPVRTVQQEAELYEFSDVASLGDDSGTVTNHFPCGVFALLDDLDEGLEEELLPAGKLEIAHWTCLLVETRSLCSS